MINQKISIQQKTSERFIYSSLACIIGSIFLNTQAYAQTDDETETAQNEEKIVGSYYASCGPY